MTEPVLDARIRRHNTVAWGKAAGYLAGAAIAWFVSWWVMWGMAFVFMGLWGMALSWISQTSAWAAWYGCALLAVEGVRYGKKLFDLDSYSRSPAFRASSADPRVSLMLTGRLNPLGVPYFISQCLFVAPRFTVGMVRALRSIVSLNAETRAKAEAALALLAGNNG
jgi:hypothetical protein